MGASRQATMFSGSTLLLLAVGCSTTLAAEYTFFPATKTHQAAESFCDSQVGAMRLASYPFAPPTWRVVAIAPYALYLHPFRSLEEGTGAWRRGGNRRMAGPG